jgi:hypothetical protein
MEGNDAHAQHPSADIHQPDSSGCPQVKVDLRRLDATADIEGVLIHGAQGVRSLTVVLLPRS